MRAASVRVATPSLPFGPVLRHQPQRITAAAPLGHHGNLPGVIQGSPHPGPHDRVIVYDDDRQRTCSLTRLFPCHNPLSSAINRRAPHQ